MNDLNLEDIREYFKFFSEDEKEIFTCVLLTPDSTDVIKGYGCWFAALKDVLAEFPRLYAQTPCTLHHTLNQTNLTGRKTKDIEACRVLCVDLDTQKNRGELYQLVAKHDVQMVVESSPGKFHLYWRVTPELGLKTWQMAQIGIAGCLGGDRNLSQLAHTIRVPGIPRQCKDGSFFTPLILDFETFCV